MVMAEAGCSHKPATKYCRVLCLFIRFPVIGHIKIPAELLAARCQRRYALEGIGRIKETLEIDPGHE